MLKNSARNCTLELSEIFRDREILVHREIQVEQRRTDNAIAAGIAQRFEQVPGMPGFGFFEPGGLKPKGTHCAAIAGVAFGSVKQLGLM